MGEWMKERSLSATERLYRVAFRDLVDTGRELTDARWTGMSPDQFRKAEAVYARLVKLVRYLAARRMRP